MAEDGYRIVWSARVHGDGGRFERAALARREDGSWQLLTESASEGSADRAILRHEDVERLADAIVAETREHD